MLGLVWLTLLVTIASARMIFEDCGCDEIKSVNIIGCSGDSCVVHKGNEVTITVEFINNQDSNTVKIDLIAELGEFQLQIPGVETDGCKFIKCPLVKGETSTLKYVVTIPSNALTIEADVIVKFIGDGKKELGCLSIHGKIVD